jgi:hypothetical protein
MDGARDLGSDGMGLRAGANTKCTALYSIEAQLILARCGQGLRGHQPYQLLLHGVGNATAIARTKTMQHEFLDMDFDRPLDVPSGCGWLRFSH